MLNIVIPMAGRGSRFEEAGYTTYKPLLPIGDKTMIERVTENVTPRTPHEFTFILQEEREKEIWPSISDKSDYTITLNGLTEGAACTVLKAKELINNAQPLLIVNSDQLVDWDINDFLRAAEQYDSCILTLPATENKYSYIEPVVTSVGDEVIRTAEKLPISGYGTVGIYYWKMGSDFVRSAERMIEDDDRYNNEFYVCPTFNYLPRTKRIGFYNVEATQAHFLGAPKEYEEYCKNI